MTDTHSLIGSRVAAPRLQHSTFEPHPWLRNPHVQTIVGRYLGGSNPRLESRGWDVELEDGDRLRVLESIPPGWHEGQPAAVLVHGLAGCARSPYMVRVARRLIHAGVRIVRMNLRGAGEGFGLARRIYHAGRSGDIRRVLEWLAARSGPSPIALIGFSLGASLSLKVAAESAQCAVPGLDCVLAANPPIDLAACANQMRLPRNRIYDWNFVRWLKAQVQSLHRRFPELGPTGLERVDSVYEFDDRYTAPRSGFASAADYYARCSVLPHLARIALPGLVVHAEDDPFIPAEHFRQVEVPVHLELELTRHGGHLGYLGRSPWQGDRRWLDVRLTSWLTGYWGIPENRRGHAPRPREGSRPTDGG